MKYSLISRIGQGAYGIVLKAQNAETGELVAIKQIILKSDSKSQLDVFREINSLKNTEHKNIVHLIETIFTSNNVSLIFEYVETNLKLIILDESRPQTENLTRFLFKQLLSGINYLHSDLKPENILVSSKCRVKIADFGLACLYFPKTNKTYSHQVATRWYRAPELLFGSVTYDTKIDLWAFGCILAEYLRGRPLFEGQSDIEQICRVFQILGTPTEESWPEWSNLPDSGKVHFETMPLLENWNSIVPNAPPNLMALIRSVIRLNPLNRSTAMECLKMEFFSVPIQRPIGYRPSAPSERILDSKLNDWDADSLAGFLDFDIQSDR